MLHHLPSLDQWETIGPIPLSSSFLPSSSPRDPVVPPQKVRLDPPGCDWILRDPFASASLLPHDESHWAFRPCGQDELTIEAFRWSLSLMSKIMMRTISEGSRIPQLKNNAWTDAAVLPRVIVGAHVRWLLCGHLCGHMWPWLARLDTGDEGHQCQPEVSTEKGHGSPSDMKNTWKDRKPPTDPGGMRKMKGTLYSGMVCSHSRLF